MYGIFKADRASKISKVIDSLEQIGIGSFKDKFRVNRDFIFVQAIEDIPGIDNPIDEPGTGNVTVVPYSTPDTLVRELRPTYQPRKCHNRGPNTIPKCTYFWAKQIGPELVPAIPVGLQFTEGICPSLLSQSSISESSLSGSSASDSPSDSGSSNPSNPSDSSGSSNPSGSDSISDSGSSGSSGSPSASSDSGSSVSGSSDSGSSKSVSSDSGSSVSSDSGSSVSSDSGSSVSSGSSDSGSSISSESASSPSVSSDSSGSSPSQSSPSGSSDSGSSDSGSSASSDSGSPSTSSPSEPSTPNPSSVSGSSGDSVSGSEKSSAVVPASWNDAGFTALFVTEAPEVKFYDHITTTITQMNQDVKVDPRFIEVCENDIVVTGAVSSKPVAIGAEFQDSVVHVMFGKQNRKIETLITLSLAGTRKGFAGMRFPDRTLAEYVANEEFLSLGRVGVLESYTPLNQRNSPQPLMGNLGPGGGGIGGGDPGGDPGGAPSFKPISVSEIA